MSSNDFVAPPLDGSIDSAPSIFRFEADASAETVDAVFDALADARRRCALDSLYAADGSLDVETLARRVREREPSGRRVSLESVEIGLVHAHLPKLRDGGLVTYSPERAEVALTDRGSAVVERLAK